MTSLPAAPIPTTTPTPTPTSSTSHTSSPSKADVPPASTSDAIPTDASPAEAAPAAAVPDTPVVPSTAQQALQQSFSLSNLETEVDQVKATFTSWWGGVKKQSASAFTSLKEDIDKTVSQAQADLEYLRTAQVEIVRKKDTETTPKPPPTADKGKGADNGPTSEAMAGAPHTLLDRLTSSTSQLQHTLQHTFQTTLASAAANPAISNPSQLRAQLAENLRLSSARENLQLSMKQAEKMAEDYLRKGDQWVKDAEKWMGDAVKVLPPDADDDTRYVATSFDGGDFYSFSTSTPKTSTPTTTHQSELRPTAAGSRKEGLLTRLREDKELLLVDPQGESETDQRRKEFRDWVTEEWPTSTGKEAEIGHVGAIRMALVPEHLTDEQFWQRYLFHKHMIDAEDAKRKKLLEASQQAQQEDFSWDDEPEEAPAAPKSAVPAKITASSSTSPRDSEESYDLVSDQGGAKAPAKPAAAAAAPAAANDDEDSDWE